jgi:two-component system NtrC family sensor kinase
MQRNHYGRLRKTLLYSMILLPVIPFVLALAIGYYYFTGSLETQTVSNMERIIEDHRQMIESFLRERRKDLEMVADTYPFSELSNPEQLERVFRRLQEKSEAFADLGVFNQDGLHVAYQGPYPLTGKMYPETAWFREVMRQGVYISDIFMGYRKTPHFVIAIARREKNVQWVIRATIDSYMFNRLVEQVRIGRTGEAYLLNENGVFQTERRSGGLLMETDALHGQYPPPGKKISTFIRPDENNIDYLYATTWLRNKNWHLVVRQEKNDAFRSLRSAAVLIILTSIIGGIVIVGVALFVTDRIIRRMENIDKEKESLQQQLILASRMAELGEMAAGFAHEINNPLQIIRSEQALIETIMEEMKVRGELSETEDLLEIEDSIAQIALQIGRCADITQAILKFGRQKEPVAENIPLGAFISEVARMVTKKASVHDIALRLDLEKETVIQGDASQLQQVFLNLFNNAIDAILDGNGTRGGEIQITTKILTANEVQIIVQDNGIGVEEENLKKIFSPFFTTKPVGKGTGLGLSVCYGIVSNMGGTMHVTSKQGSGTAFTLTLPAAPETEQE